MNKKNLKEDQNKNLRNKLGYYRRTLWVKTHLTGTCSLGVYFVCDFCCMGAITSKLITSDFWEDEVSSSKKSKKKFSLKSKTRQQGLTLSLHNYIAMPWNTPSGRGIGPELHWANPGYWKRSYFNSLVS